MDKKKAESKIQKIVKEFARELAKEIDVERIILFGSYAKGNPRKDSDLDLLIISPDFTKMDFWQRVKILARARKNYEFAMDYFGISPREYQKAGKLTTLGEIKRTGRVIPL